MGIDSLLGAEISVAWDPNQEPDLAGYRVHYGTESGAYTETLDVGNATTATIGGLTAGTTYYSSLTAYNSYGLESDYSNEISFTIPPDPPPSSDLVHDHDRDGLSARFEQFYGNGADLHPLSDLDQDGLTALAEYAHGLDPTVGTGFSGELDIVLIAGERHLGIRYFVNPFARQFVNVQVERTVNLNNQDAWATGQTIKVSSQPSIKHPGLLEILERSATPIGTQRHEFLRISYTAKPEPSPSPLGESGADSDKDGLADRFEQFHGNGQDLDPLSDQDNDGLGSLGEYVHGLDPTVATQMPGDLEIISVSGIRHLAIRYTVNPFALPFAKVQVERSVNPQNPGSWATGQTTLVSSLPSITKPGLLEIVERSTTPIGTQRAEFLRIRHTVLAP